MEARELYNTFHRSLKSQGFDADTWDELEAEDQKAWNEVADSVERWHQDSLDEEAEFREMDEAEKS